MYSVSLQEMYEEKNIGEINSDFRHPTASPLRSLKEIGFALKETLDSPAANLHWFNFKYNITLMALSLYYSSKK